MAAPALPLSIPALVLLQEIATGHILYAPLALTTSWRELIAHGCVRVCAYPDEDVVVLVNGRALLRRMAPVDRSEEGEEEAGAWVS